MKTRIERVAWLLEQNWISRYMENFNSARRTSYSLGFDNGLNFILYGDIDEAISGAFTWSSTMEGDEFWRKKHREFVNFCGREGLNGAFRVMLF